MSLNPKMHQEYRTVKKLVIAIANGASYSLKVENQIVHVTANGAATLYLPPVAEAQGRTYYIVRVGASTNALTVADLDDSLGWADITTLDATNDRVALTSDGEVWWTDASKIA